MICSEVGKGKQCVNTLGSYTCICQDGDIADGDGNCGKMLHIYLYQKSIKL